MEKLDLLRDIELLTSKGVGLSFYNCDDNHLTYKFPYNALYLCDIHIRIYKNSTEEKIKAQIDEAKKHLVQLLEETGTDADMSSYSELYQYLYRWLTFSTEDIEKLKIINIDYPNKTKQDYDVPVYILGLGSIKVPLFLINHWNLKQDEPLLKCPYCDKTEVCKGSYPEGCFLENQLNERKELN